MTTAARNCAGLVALALALGAAAEAAGPVLLTISGAIENANRGAVDPTHDRLFVMNDVAFDAAMEFDADALAALPQATVHADFPKNGQVSSFTGPLLADVLAAAGATGDRVRIQALDGDVVEVAAAQMTDKGAVVALARDGKPLGDGGYGPAQIAFPRIERGDLAAMNDEWWVWQVYHIEVE